MPRGELERMVVDAQASIGIAMQPLGFSPGSATTPDELLRNAEQLLRKLVCSA